jgi:acetyltransferase-like isoleucine patch superfamily enzyme
MIIIKQIRKYLTRIRCISLYRNKNVFYKHYFPTRVSLGSCGINSILEYPVFFDTPENVFIGADVIIRSTARIVNSPKEKVFIKRYTVIGPDCMIISNSHQKTVGLPQFLSGISHINDKSSDIIINEDVWIGAKVIIMPGAEIGRGSIIGAGTLVNHFVPPYSVVVGSPAKIIGKVFCMEDIIKHEQELYDIRDRMSIDEIVALSTQYNYASLKTFGNNRTLTTEEELLVTSLKKQMNYVGNQ